MYIETSKQQQGSPCKNSDPKCFKATNFDRFHREYINQYNLYRCERGRVGNVLNSVMFPLRSKLFIISRSTNPLNFTDLNSYSTEISSQNKFFDMYIVKEKATRKFLMQNFLPGMFKMTNFDRFHREAMGAGAFKYKPVTRLLF